MKNLKLILLGLISAIAISSCTPTSNYNKTDLPIEIVELKEAKKFDTTLLINTDKHAFQFSYETNNYITTIDKTRDENSPLMAGIIIGFIFGIFVTLIVTAVSR